MPHPRKEAAAQRERDKKDKTREEAVRKAEDAKWMDDGDKARKAREARLADRERKTDEQLQKTLEKQELLKREEEENLRSGKNKKLQQASTKIRQADIRISALSGMSFDKQKKKPVPEVVNDQPLEPNLNKEAMKIEALTGVKHEVATGTVEAISAISAVLGKDGKIDAHPERRMKAAHAAFEEIRMKELQLEKPNLKRTQYKEIIWKEWQKSPENPMFMKDQIV
jgi:hypothetical protein